MGRRDCERRKIVRSVGRLHDGPRLQSTTQKPHELEFLCDKGLRFMLPIRRREPPLVEEQAWLLRLANLAGSRAFEGFVVPALYLGASAFAECPPVRSN